MSNGTKGPPWYRNSALWVSCASLVVAGLSAAFTGLQWREAHNQWLFSVKPHVDFDTEDDPDVPPVGIAVNNAGPGPAIVKSVTYYVDRRPVKDYNQAVEYGKINAEIVGYFELEPGDTLAVGEKDWLLQYRKPRGGKVKQKDLDNFLEFIDQRVTIKVSFCTLTEDLCWEKCSTKGRCD
jgi:hypothetical protein